VARPGQGRAGERFAHHLGSLQEYLPGPTRVLVVAGRTALLAGRLRAKLNRRSEAFNDLALAAALADDADDRPLRALVLAARAGLYSAIAGGRRHGDATRAMALADASVEAAAPPMPARLLGAALGRRAEERAAAGDASGALRDLDDAERTLREPQDGGVYFGARAPR
jgi:hypothetical protein